MINELSSKLTRVVHDFFREQKNSIKLYFKGEEAILLFLSEKLDKEVVTPGDISEKLYITTARVAASLNSLQSKELITREIDCEDRRKIIIELTDKGKKMALDLKEKHLEELNNLLSKLGEDDTSELLRIIENITKILQEGKSYA